MLSKEYNTEMNKKTLAKVFDVVKTTADRLIGGEVTGILKRPTNMAELEDFNNNINDILLIKLRNKFIN